MKLIMQVQVITPEQAKQVLQDGGWTYAKQPLEKEIDGVTRTLRLKIAVDKDNQTRVAVADLIKEQLEAIGMEVRVNKISKNQYNEYIGGGTTIKFYLQGCTHHIVLI